jgi:hypothetical protein
MAVFFSHSVQSVFLTLCCCNRTLASSLKNFLLLVLFDSLLQQDPGIFFEKILSAGSL